jgi:hypothetical protein
VLQEFEVTSGSSFIAQPYPLQVRTELAWNGLSKTIMTFDDDDKWLRKIEDHDDARVRVRRDDEILMTGWFAKRGGTGPQGTTTVEFWDDFADVAGLGWPNPAAAISAQTDEYARYTGPTETVVKAACAALSARLGHGWTIPATTGLGSPQRVELRFHPLLDKLVPLVVADRLMWTVKDGVVDVVEGALFDRTLTAESGLIEHYEWEYNAPTATRAVVGGSGEGVARAFEEYVDATLETQWGRPVEVFKDSRMADGEPLEPDAVETLAANAPRASVSIDLQEGRWFKYGAYRLGDRIPIKIGALETTDVVSRIVFEETAEGGELITPHIGTLETSTDARMRSAIGRISRGLRDQGRR